MRWPAGSAVAPADLAIRAMGDPDQPDDRREHAGRFFRRARRADVEQNGWGQPLDQPADL
jgi:hypothetical protein